MSTRGIISGLATLALVLVLIIPSEASAQIWAGGTDAMIIRIAIIFVIVQVGICLAFAGGGKKGKETKES